jgi:hypothetical protein
MEGHRTEWEHALVQFLHGLLPKHVEVILLADRGFGDQAFYALLSLLGWDYVIRFRGDILVTSSEGETKPAVEWLASGGRPRMLRGAAVTADKAPVGAVVVVHAKRMKDPWCLATSLADEKAADIIALYARRFTIEETFRDQKDMRFGLGLSATHIRRTDRRDRLLLLFALAHALLTLLGEASERSGLDKTIKGNHVTRRTHSLFWQGSFWFRQLLTMRQDWFHRLMTALNDVVKEHASLKEMFGVI